MNYPEEYTDNLIEDEVCKTLAGYKLVLLHTNYNSLGYRILCFLKDKESLKYQAELEKIEIIARKVVNQSPEHQIFVELISNQQPEFIRVKDKFYELLYSQVNKQAD